MNWQSALPSLNELMPNNSQHVAAFPTTNMFNPYILGYGHTLPGRTQYSVPQINTQLLYNLHLTSGSMMYSGLQSSQIQSESAHQHFNSTTIHQNMSERQGYQIPCPSFENLGFYPTEAIPDRTIPAEKIEKSCRDRSHNSDGKFKARVEYPLCVKLGAKQCRTKYLEGSIQIRMARFAH